MCRTIERIEDLTPPAHLPCCDRRSPLGVPTLVRVAATPCGPSPPGLFAIVVPFVCLELLQCNAAVRTDCLVLWHPVQRKFLVAAWTEKIS